MDRILDDVVALDPERSALIVAGEAVSYRQLAVATGQVATGLQSAGVSPGWRIPLVDDTSVLAVATLLGATHIGAATALMNPRLTAGELAQLMLSARTESTGVAGDRYSALAVEAGIDPVLGAATLLDGAPGRDGGAPGRDGGGAGRDGGGAGRDGGGAGRDARGSDRMDRVDAAPRDDAVVLFTSGTTGTPKAVPLTHGALAARVGSYSPSVDPRPAVSIMCVPLVHIGGMLGLLVALARGSTTVVQTRFDPGEWLALVQRHKVTTAFVVPTMLYRILEHPDFPATDLSSLASLTYGAAPATPELIRRTMEALPGVALSNTFGQTETMGSITALGPGDHPPERLASVGKPLPGVEIRIVHPSTGTDVEQGSVGELWVRSEVAIVPEAQGGDTATPPGWFRTGDMIWADADGYLYPAGRLSDTINRGGEKFAPSEVEDVVRAHPAVLDVAAFGVPDSEMGHRVGVAIVARRPLDLDQLREFCRGRIANFKQPERLLVLSELPLTEFGKVDRKELRSRCAEP